MDGAILVESLVPMGSCKEGVCIMKRFRILALLLAISGFVSADEITRYPPGVSTGDIGSLWQNVPVPQLTRAHIYFDDFDRFDLSDWSVTTTAYVTTPSSGLSDADKGLLNTTGVNGVGGAKIHQGTAETFTFELGKELWFEARASVVNVTSCTAVVGLCQTSSYDYTDAQIAAFIKPPTTSSTMFVLRAAAPTTSTSSTVETSIDTVAEATYVTYGIYYDGEITLTYYVDGYRAGSVARTNMPTAEITPTFGIISDVTGSAANQMNFDYVFVAKER